MSYSLERFANGDTNYVAKLNTNADVIEAALNFFSSSVAGASSVANLPNLYKALFGPTPAIIGAASLAASAVGLVLTIGAGEAWLPGKGAVISKGTSTNLDFTGQPDGTYYVTADSAGALLYQTVDADSLYRVVKAGAALTITRWAAIAWGQQDWLLAQSSALLGTFTSLDARLEAIEAHSSPFEIAMFATGTYTANQLLSRAVLASAVSFGTGTTSGSKAWAGVASTGSVSLIIKKNGASVGSVAFTAGNQVGTVSFDAATSFAISDRLELYNAASPDASLADISVTFKGART